MAMGFGDSSLLLSMHATSHIHCSSATVNAVSRSPGCSRTVILGAAPSFESRVPRNRSRTRRVPAIQAAESRSADAALQSPATNGGNTGQGSPKAQSHLDLLQRMTENSSASQGAGVKTIRDQLVSQGEAAEAVEAEEAVVSLTNGEAHDSSAAAAAGGGVPPPPELTISQRRNIRRQNYLNKVSERNDAPFFASVAAVVLVPPLLILAFAVATGYVDLFP